MHTLGSDIFQLVQDNCDPAHLDARDYIRGLCAAGKTWGQLGNAQRASWCIGHAVRYAERLEALMASNRMPTSSREGCAVQLFDMYIEAALNCAGSNQQVR